MQDLTGRKHGDSKVIKFLGSSPTLLVDTLSLVDA